MGKTAMLLVGLLMIKPVAAQNLKLFPGEGNSFPLLVGWSASPLLKGEEDNSQAQDGPISKTSLAGSTTLAFLANNLPASKQAGAGVAPMLPSVTWKDGKTTITFANAELSFSHRMQLRFTDLQVENGHNVPSFRVRQFKTILNGWVYDKDLRYELQLNWADAKPLDVASVSYDLSRGKNLLVIKAGQFKVPFGRQQLASAGSLEFVDRSIVSTTFARGKDIGVELSGLPWGGKLDWRVGAFNGAGRNAIANDNGSLQVDARVAWQPFGQLGLSEGDLNVSSEPKVALAAQFESNDRRDTPDNVKQITWGGDGELLWRGFFLFTEFFHGRREPVGIPAYDSKGLALQAGLTFVPARWEVAARYAVVNPSDRRKHDLQTEKGVALNYFIRQHGHKLQADLRQLEDERLKERSWEFRLQYQLVF
ncbi:MAG: porin [Thermoanaerobaculaceae bacterium]